MPSDAIAAVRCSGGTARPTAPTSAVTPDPLEPKPSNTPAAMRPAPVETWVISQNPTIEHSTPATATRAAPNRPDQKPNKIAPKPHTRLAIAMALENGSRPMPSSMVTGRKYKPSTWRRLMARPVIRQAAAMMAQGEVQRGRERMSVMLAWYPCRATLHPLTGRRGSAGYGHMHVIDKTRASDAPEATPCNCAA